MFFTPLFKRGPGGFLCNLLKIPLYKKGKRRLTSNSRILWLVIKWLLCPLQFYLTPDKKLSGCLARPLNRLVMCSFHSGML